ncbi:MAG TPA: methyltransferase domain-containing protein [Solirubrobacteraceae bacterium]|nr:methyltransferase domain-containing protein [Solirubrobacteraceae bacterium]
MGLPAAELVLGNLADKRTSGEKSLPWAGASFYSRFGPDSREARESPGRPFAGDTASFYARYRRAYPPELISRLREFSRGGRGRLLDLGCGTGQLLLQLAGFFEQAVGIDPEPDMLREARRIAHEQQLANTEWMTGGSTDLRTLEPVLGRFDLVTIGTAFHFMDAPVVLGDLQRVAAGGAVAVAYNGAPMWLQSDPWAQELRSVLQSRLGPLSDGDFTTEALQAAEETMRDLGYTSVERWEQINAETIDVDFIVGHILSATSTDQIPPDDRTAFAEEVRAAITALEPSGRVVETVPVRAVIGHTTA